jgi:hypothetical protein
MTGTIKIERPQWLNSQSRYITYTFDYVENLDRLKFYSMKRMEVPGTSNLYRLLKEAFIKKFQSKLKKVA